MIRKYSAIICKGSAEEAIVEILLENHCIVIKNDEYINNKGELVDEYTDLLHVTRISNMIDKVFEEMTILQSKHEDRNHWGGNYLGYIQKYQKGNEILDYFSTGNSEVLKPLILESEKRENKLSDHLRERLYIKTY